MFLLARVFVLASPIAPSALSVLRRSGGVALCATFGSWQRFEGWASRFEGWAPRIEAWAPRLEGWAPRFEDWASRIEGKTREA